jgi:hypothetical protein
VRSAADHSLWLAADTDPRHSDERLTTIMTQRKFAGFSAPHAVRILGSSAMRANWLQAATDYLRRNDPHVIAAQLQRRDKLPFLSN